MVQALLNGIIFLFIRIIGVLGSIIIYPLQLIVVQLFPSLGEFSAEALNWIIQNIFPVICFLKHFFLGLTGFPEELWSLLVAELFLWFSLAISVRSLMLVYRLYLFFKGTEV